MKKCPGCLREYKEDKAYCPYDGKLLTLLRYDDIYIDTVLDLKYRIEYKIAEGGMGNVYRATHMQLNSPVAIKILHPSLMSDGTAIERFRREAQAAMQIRHTNAIAVLDFGLTQNNTVYLVMEFLEGCTLRQRLREVGFISVAETNKIFQQICAAVQVAHKRKIIHRDLKPDNIFLQQEAGEEIVKVLDFGIAKLKDQNEGPLTRHGMVVGTPHYMSPEQCYGREVDVRSDIYSLGVILYEMLTGRVPFDASTSVALAIKQTSEKPPPMQEVCTHVSAEINTVVMHALEKNAEDRPQTVQALVKELETAIVAAETRIKLEATAVESQANNSSTADSDLAIPVKTLPTAKRIHKEDNSSLPTL
ncbi:MAG: serine/threonine-protein kinase, partial [Acidobacteriota bacterium]